MAPAPSKPKYDKENNKQHPNNTRPMEEVNNEQSNNNNDENGTSELPTDEDEDNEFDHIPDEGLRALLYLLRVQGLFVELFYRFHELEHQESNNIIPSADPLAANTIPTPAEMVAPVEQIPTVAAPPTGSPVVDCIHLCSCKVEKEWESARKD
jgi:hypothetical protein